MAQAHVAMLVWSGTLTGPTASYFETGGGGALGGDGEERTRYAGKLRYDCLAVCKFAKPSPPTHANLVFRY